MTLDDLELENNLFSSFRRQYLANSTHRCRALTFASAGISCYLFILCCQYRFIVHYNVQCNRNNIYMDKFLHI